MACVCFMLILCYNNTMSDKIRKNYYIKREIANFSEKEADEKGCSESYFIQMLIEEYIRKKYYEE